MSVRRSRGSKPADRRRLLRPTLVLVAAAMLSGGVGPARAASVDQRSTRLFIAATVDALGAAVAAHGRLQPAIDAVIARVASGCPGGLADSSTATMVQRATRATLRGEAEAQLELADLAPIAGVFPGYARRIGRLRWTQPALQRAVARSIRRGRKELALVPPDLCADIAAAAATGFATVPSEATAFVRAATSLLTRGPSASDLLARMKPFIGPSEAAAVRHLDRLQHRLDVLFGEPATAAYERLYAALGVDRATLVG